MFGPMKICLFFYLSWSILDIIIAFTEISREDCQFLVIERNLFYTGIFIYCLVVFNSTARIFKKEENLRLDAATIRIITVMNAKTLE